MFNCATWPTYSNVGLIILSCFEVACSLSFLFNRMHFLPPPRTPPPWCCRGLYHCQLLKHGHPCIVSSKNFLRIFDSIDSIDSLNAGWLYIITRAVTNLIRYSTSVSLGHETSCDCHVCHGVSVRPVVSSCTSLRGCECSEQEFSWSFTDVSFCADKNSCLWPVLFVCVSFCRTMTFRFLLLLCHRDHR